MFLLPDGEAEPRVAIDYHVIAAETLKDVEALKVYFSERKSAADSAHRRCVLGPVTSLKETAPNEPFRLLFEPVVFEPAAEVTQVGVIIDIGIAYWNAVFQGKNGPRFKAMSYLDFDAVQIGKPPFATLPDTEIYRHCKMAGDLDGQDRIVAELAAQFPDSYFSDPAGAVAGRFGTAQRWLI